MARMTKDELREDPILERIQATIDFLQRNSRWFLAGAALIVVVIVGAMVLGRTQERNRQAAAQLLAEGQANYMMGNLPVATDRLQELLASYGGTPSANPARLYLGEALLAQEQPDEALALYEEARAQAGHEAHQQAAAERGRAAALEDLGRFAEASAAFEAAAGLAPFGAADDLVQAGRTALAAGEPSRARELLERARAEGADAQRTQLEFYLAQAEAAAQP